MSCTFANHTFLVTGGMGFMGSAFIRHLLAQDNFRGKIINLDLLTYASHLGNLAAIEEDPRYFFVKGDVGNGSLLRKIQEMHPIDVIVHFAAETHVDRSIHTPRPFVETNTLGMTELLEFVRENPSIRLHHISTDEVYGSLGETGRFDETSPYRPNSPYSASKAAADHFVLAYGKTYDLQVTISHACNNYGPHQFPEKFIPLMTLNCMQKKLLPIYGNGKNQRDWLYVYDHCSAIETILEKGEMQEVYNIGSGHECTNLELLERIIEYVAAAQGESVSRYRELIAFVPDRPGHDFRYALATDKMESLGWKPTVSLSEGIKKTVEWYHTHEKWVKEAQSEQYHEWVSRQYPQAFAEQDA